jgi:hypothetical protein
VSARQDKPGEPGFRKREKVPVRLIHSFGHWRILRSGQHLEPVRKMKRVRVGVKALIWVLGANGLSMI